MATEQQQQYTVADLANTITGGLSFTGGDDWFYDMFNDWFSGTQQSYLDAFDTPQMTEGEWEAKYAGSLYMEDDPLTTDIDESTHYNIAALMEDPTQTGQEKVDILKEQMLDQWTLGSLDATGDYTGLNISDEEWGDMTSFSPQELGLIMQDESTRLRWLMETMSNVAGEAGAGNPYDINSESGFNYNVVGLQGPDGSPQAGMGFSVAEVLEAMGDGSSWIDKEGDDLLAHMNDSMRAVV